MEQDELFSGSQFRFGPRFLKDHAGQIITVPEVAIVELVANAYDAGASTIDVTWPEALGQELVVEDNGTGMTPEELYHRWTTISYSRVMQQGQYVQYPPDVSAPRRRLAFGQNGKGRYSPFCFSDHYEIESWKEGTSVRAHVSKTDDGAEPFRCEIVGTTNREGHGSRVSAKLVTGLLPVSAVRDAVGSKFLVDPYVAITVNGVPLRLLSFDRLATSYVEVPPFGTLTIHQIDAPTHDRTTNLRGITWWVNSRMVGEPSWEGLENRGSLLDGRTALAKKCSFVIEADFLHDDVRADWSGMHDSARTQVAGKAAHEFVHEALDHLMRDTRKERKKLALAQSRETLTRLPQLSRRLVGEFVEQVQRECPTLSPGDLARTAKVFAKMEITRSGYDLLEKLAACSPSDLDTWNELMEEWTAGNAAIVLSELKRRLELIARLQTQVDSDDSDELHDLQPLFGRGLWIFGPEFEAVDFTSNRRMSTVVGTFLGESQVALSSRRPDFVALPDASSVSCYAADTYDDAGEVLGVRKVLIVELKRAGLVLGVKELRQAQDYALEIRKASLVSDSTEILAYVLGSGTDAGAKDDLVSGAIRVRPVTYERILRRAHARTFNLQRLLSQAAPQRIDLDVEEVLGLTDADVEMTDACIVNSGVA